ncbi:MAG: hypothetical protein ACXWYM_00445 [Candidatus Binatia bacterium]
MTTTYETKLSKHHYNGWTAETEITLNDLPKVPEEHKGEGEGTRTLRFSTSKDSRGNIKTTATVMTVRASGIQTHVFGFGAAGGDFRVSVGAVLGKKATEKAVRAAHEEMMAAHVDHVIAQANAFYVQKQDAAVGY